MLGSTPRRFSHAFAGVTATALAALMLTTPVAVAAASDLALRPGHHHHHHHHRHRALQTLAPRDRSAEPAAPKQQERGFEANPPGAGDTDGLSRDPDDCDKGCIGGNPR